MRTSSPRPPLTGIAFYAMRLLWLLVILAVMTNLTTFTTIVTGGWIIPLGPDASLGSASVPMPLDALPQISSAVLAPGESGTLRDVPVALRILCAIPQLLQAATVILAIITLGRIIAPISAGKAFSAVVVENWKKLSLVLIIGTVAAGVVDTAAVVSVIAATANSTTHFTALYTGWGLNPPDFQPVLLALGLVSVVLGLAFRAGAQLRREVEGLV